MTRMSDSRLQGTILQLSADAMQEYAASAARVHKPSREWPKERWIQVSVARDLAKKYNCLVDVEVPKLQFQERWNARIEKSQAIDLVIAEVTKDRSARLRAIVEFKRDIWKDRPRADVERTISALASIQVPGALGMVVVCHSDFDEPAASEKHIDEGKKLARLLGARNQSAASSSKTYLTNSDTTEPLSV